MPAKRSNLIMQFDSDSEEEQQEEQVSQALDTKTQPT